MDAVTSSVVLTKERSEVHYASYPHVFIEDSQEAPAQASRREQQYGTRAKALHSGFLQPQGRL